MPRLYLMRGLPGSGKSTRAREIVRTQPKTVRVNRDDLRAMLFGDQWMLRQEHLVIALEKRLVSEAAGKGYSVVIDDTNLLNDIWTPLAKRVGMEVVVEDLRRVPLETCIARDASRDRAVGRAVIENMARRAALIAWPDRQIVLVDMDGTLADATHRQQFIRQTPRDWNGFFKSSIDDRPNEIVVRWVRALHESRQFTIVIVSGRPDDFGDIAIRWLRDHEIPFDRIFLRRRHDTRPEYKIKEEILQDLPIDKISFVIEDGTPPCEMWRRHGLTVYCVRI